MARVLSPADVRLLMHIYAIPKPPENPVHDTLDEWVAEGIIEHDPSRGGVFRCTEKGNKWVDMICSTPKPVSVWCDPREKQ